MQTWCANSTPASQHLGRPEINFRRPYAAQRGALFGRLSVALDPIKRSLTAEGDKRARVVGRLTSPFVYGGTGALIVASVVAQQTSWLPRLCCKLADGRAEGACSNANERFVARLRSRRQPDIRWLSRPSRLAGRQKPDGPAIHLSAS